MIYESSYESGRIPFIPDLSRGHWSKTSDFIYASLGISFRMLGSLLIPLGRRTISITSLIPAFAVGLVVYSVPLLVVQSFMGQFSSSGFLSAFRLSPIFKGIGYVALFLNILDVVFLSFLSMLSVVHLAHAFNALIPWTCNEDEHDNCNHSTFIVQEEPYTPYISSTYRHYKIFGLEIVSSWQMLLAAISIWIILAILLYKIRDISRIGQLIRYSLQIVIILLFIIIIRLCCLPSSGEILFDLFMPNWNDLLTGMVLLPNFAISVFGHGWGLILTLASFNKFNTNIQNTSWWLAGVHTLIVILWILLEFLLKNFALREKHGSISHTFDDPYLTSYVTFGSVFEHVPWKTLWAIIFYAMLSLEGLVAMILQLNIILFSIFDEFIALRRYKTPISLSLIVVMASSSLYLSTYHGKANFAHLRFDTLITQSLIDLLVILAVLWIYGRQRFQRDFEFMINERFATWKIYILRFLAPLLLLIIIVGYLFLEAVHLIFGSATIAVFNVIVRPLPWLFVPAYVVYCVIKFKGSLKIRLKKSCRPTDWYPVDIEDRQRYENLVNTENMTHPLNILCDEENL